MKRLILVFFLFSGLMAKSQCDTMTSATFTAITTNSVNVSFTVGGSNWTSFNVSLYDSATGAVAFNIPTLTTFTFAAAGLTAGRTYVLRTFTNVPFGGSCEPNGTLPKFRTLTNIVYTPMAANGYSFKRISVDSNFHLPLQDTLLYRGILRAGALVHRPQDSILYSWNGRNWTQVGNASKIISDSLKNFVRLQTQNPTAGLTGGFTYERRPSATVTLDIDWSAGRQAATPSAAATATIATINVDGINQTFTQPTIGSSVTGTKSVTFALNTNITYNNTVTTSDGKTATASTSFNVFDKRYIGWATTDTPTDAEIRAAINQDNNGGTVGYSTTLAQLGTSRYLFYANTAAINGVSVNGFPSSDAFNLNVSRSLTNTVGGTTTYFVTTSKNAIGATSATSLTIN